MVIAAFMGTGAEAFSERVEGVIDLSAMPYREAGAQEREDAESKSDSHGVLRSEWPDNYNREVANHFHDCRYYIIQPDKQVLEGLQLLQIPYILVYPEVEAKEEYIGISQKSAGLELSSQGRDEEDDTSAWRDCSEETRPQLNSAEIITAEFS